MTTEHRCESEEIWKPVALPGFEGLYPVSDQGRVRTTYERAYNYPSHYLMKVASDKRGFSPGDPDEARRAT